MVTDGTGHHDIPGHLPRRSSGWTSRYTEQLAWRARQFELMASIPVLRRSSGL